MKTTVQLLALLFIALLSPRTAQGQQQKNVMLIIMDDLNVSVGPYGNSVVHTPNFDRLASRGVTFLNANCQYALCNPSRTSFLSGLRPDITRIHDNLNASRLYLGTAVPFLPEYFKINGYYTASWGKVFHNIAQDPRSWSTVAVLGVLPYSEIRSLTVSSSDPNPIKLKHFEVADADESKLGDYRIAGDVTGKLESLTGSMPWLLAVGFHRPHAPWTAPTKDYDLYFEPRLGTGETPPEDWLVKDSVPDPVPEPEFPSQNLPTPAYSDHGRDWTHAVTPADRKRIIAGYYASVTFVDRQLGRILDKMDELNLWENTVVVVMGDNGLQLGEHYVMWGKNKLMPESLRIPLIIVDPALPGTSRGAVCSRPTELIDLYPTLTELCDLPRPGHLAGRSLVPYLWDLALPAFDAAFSMKKYTPYPQQNFGRSIQNERWLYVEWQDGQEGVQLYDWDTDPYQVNNLADNPAYVATRTEMSVLLQHGLPPLTALDDNASTSPGSSVLVDVLRNDVDAAKGPAAIQITSVDNPTPSGSSAAIQSGKIEYIPAKGFVGSETFQYTITDGASSATGRLTMIVKPPYLADPNTYQVSMETEDYDASTYSAPSPDGLVHFWTDAYPTEDMSGDGAIQAQPILRRTLNSNSLSDRPRIDYNLTVVKSRNYFIWLRGKKHPGGGGVVEAGIRTPLGNGIAAGTVRFASGFVWKRLPVRISLTAHSAAHVLSLWMSDDGVIIDKILLLPSGQTAPAGFGPAVTPRATSVAALSTLATPRYRVRESN